EALAVVPTDGLEAFDVEVREQLLVERCGLGSAVTHRRTPDDVVLDIRAEGGDNRSDVAAQFVAKVLVDETVRFDARVMRGLAHGPDPLTRSCYQGLDNLS